jgi:hypothetical protein
MGTAAAMVELVRRGVFTADRAIVDGAPRPSPTTCWYSGLSLTACRKGGSSLSAHFAVTAEHVIPHTWGLGRAMPESLRQCNLVPAAAYVNGLVGCLPTFVKNEFRTALKAAMDGRRAPRAEDRRTAKELLGVILARHDIPSNFSPFFSSLAWVGQRLDLWDEEKKFLRRAGVDIEALIARVPAARLSMDEGLLESAPAYAPTTFETPAGEQAWERPWLRWG